MLLTSSTYFIFLVAVFFVYWPLSRFRVAALSVLLFANYFFYARWGLPVLALIPAAASCDYVFGLGMQYSKNNVVRRVMLWLSIVMNLSMLAFFKYAPFSDAGWALPISISFYVFQALTYTIDLYRRDAPGTTSYLAHLTAVSFFPTTLAGPITRVSSLIEQMDKRKPLDPADGGRALFLIGLGLVKKLMIADYLASTLVNRVFDFPNLYTAAEVLVGVYSYALQIYFDFSGYTDIAIGSALLLGIKLPANFNAPYAAINIADFWRRWHITLSNWLRDYLYFSLGGARSKWRPYLNLMVTMVLGGLWHGAGWTFVIWGALHGAGLAIVRLWQTLRPRAPGAAPSAVWRVVNIVLTFHFVTFAWIFFRSPSFEVASAVIGRMGSLTVSFANVPKAMWIILAIALLGHYVPRKIYDGSMSLFVRAPFYAQAAALAALVLGLQYVAQTGAAPFIYTNF